MPDFLEELPERLAHVEAPDSALAEALIQSHLRAVRSSEPGSPAHASAWRSIATIAVKQAIKATS